MYCIAISPRFPLVIAGSELDCDSEQVLPVRNYFVILKVESAGHVHILLKRRSDGHFTQLSSVTCFCCVSMRNLARTVQEVSFILKINACLL